jgi:[acyl-carrier-protein] S-malonyltransferase
MGAEINQRDDRGWTPLHRAAHLAQYPGYLEIYEYLLVLPACNGVVDKNTC